MTWGLPFKVPKFKYKAIKVAYGSGVSSVHFDVVAADATQCFKKIVE